MKNIRNKFLALLLITAVAFSSCKKEDRFSPSANSNTELNKDISTDRPIIGMADWKITSYQVGEEDQTKVFSEYAFKFGKDGVFKAFTTENVMNGTWSMGKAGEFFTISFPSFPLNKLNREWQIINRTATELKLENINRKGDMESVTFQRFQRQTDLTQLN